jgi:hypothetical protein
MLGTCGLKLVRCARSIIRFGRIGGVDVVVVAACRPCMWEDAADNVVVDEKEARGRNTRAAAPRAKRP